MERESYRDLLDSSWVTAKTKEVLEQRLREIAYAPTFFTQTEFAGLIKIAEALLPQIEGVDMQWCAWEFDREISEGKEKGWRYASLPPGFGTLKNFLRGEDVANANLILEDLFTALAKILYSHPASMSSIGYTGYADGKGWHDLGLNKREIWQEHSLEKGEATQLDALPIHRSQRYSYDEDVDAVIVGSGAGGAPLAARLCAQRLKVVLFEAGRHWQPEKDFATDERYQDFLYWTDERISAGEDPIAFGSNNSGIGVGGTTLHYTGYVPRPTAADFRLKTRHGVGEDWPISLEDLQPYLEEVENFIGVSGPTPYLWDPERKYPLPALPLNAAAELMQRGCTMLGIKASPAPNAALSRPYSTPGVGPRGICVNRGFCQAGCNRGAKGSTDVTFIRHALAHGLDLRPSSFVTEVELRGKDVIGVAYHTNGQVLVQRCKNVFLCCGAIETPRLFLRQDLANESGQVGMNFMAHVATQVWGFFDEITDPWKGIPGGLICEEFRELSDLPAGFILQSIGTMPLSYLEHATREGKLRGKDLHDHMSRFSHLAGINIHAECLPHPENQLYLSGEKDRRGLPKPVITFTMHENENALANMGLELMNQIWQAAGAKEVWSYRRNAHTLGTCRMGNDPQTSVTNAGGLVHGYKNLYICDTSLFPSSLTANPALTMMSLSLRIADQFLGTQ